MIITHNGNIVKFGNSIVNYQQSDSFGSLLFAGNSNSNLTINNDLDFRMGTNDFTIEWFQYQTDNNPFPRIFAIGTFPSTSIGVSIESNIFYFWANGFALSFGNVSPFKNQWVHFAITRQNSNLKVFKNGQQISNTRINTTNFNNTSSLLRIGNETNISQSASFGGYITNFHWVKGFAKYTNNFSVPITNIQPTLDSKLLILANNQNQPNIDNSGLNKVISNNNVNWNVLNPFFI
jgi:hypothetical protein